MELFGQGAAVEIRPPKREPMGSTNIRIPQRILSRLDEIADGEDLSRNQLIAHFLEYAIGRYDEETGSTGVGSPKPRRGA